MKAIENKKSRATINGENKNISVADLITIATENIPESGLSFSDIESRLKIRDAASKAGATIILEEAEYNYLKKSADLIKWAFVDPFILEFKKCLDNANTETGDKK